MFGVYPFTDESAHICHIWCKSVQPFDSSARLLNLRPPTNPRNALWGIEGDLYLAYVQSQMNPQTSTKVGANRSSRLTASQYFGIVDPLKPPSAPLVSRVAICLVYIHFQLNLHMCATFGANRSSRLVAFPECVLRLVRLLAAVSAVSRKNTPKNNS